MNRPGIRTLGRALVAAAALACACGALAPRPAAACPAADPAAWTAARAVASAESANVYRALVRWSLSKKIVYSSVEVAFRVLAYAPDDPEMRKHLGYVRDASGAWVRDHGRRMELRDAVDVADPIGSGFPKRSVDAHRSVADRWRTLARQAVAFAAAGDSTSERWRDDATACWGRVLEAVPADEEAHKALGHGRFGGRYAADDVIAWLRARDARDRRGAEWAGQAVDATAAAPTGVFAKSALPGTAARTTHIVVNTTGDEAAAVRLVTQAERALGYATESWRGPQQAVAAGLWVTYDVVPTVADVGKIARAGGMSEAEIARKTSYTGGWDVAPREHAIGYADRDAAGAWLMHTTGHRVVSDIWRAAPAKTRVRDALEDWLGEALAHDVTVHLGAERPAGCVAMGGYGVGAAGPLRANTWAREAKRLVEVDDDVPLSRLCKCRIADGNLGPSEVLKGYGFLQFLLEDDEDRARAFVRRAVAAGSEKAAAEALGTDLPALDTRYRDWIRRSW